MSILPQTPFSVNPSPFAPFIQHKSGDFKVGLVAATTEPATQPTFYGLRKSNHFSVSKPALAMCHTVARSEIKDLSRSIRVYNNLLEVSESEAASSSRRLRMKKVEEIRKRGKITKRSQKSRVNQLKHIYKLPVLPEMFSLFTWADDVSGYLSEREKKDLMNDHKRRLCRWMTKELEGQEWFLVWSKEGKRRKSGVETKGQVTPHIHALWRVNGMSEGDYQRFALRMNLKWIEITGTKDRENALRVACQRENNQYLGNSPKKAVAYSVKYSAGQESDQGDPNESIGRTYGSWGTIKPAAPEEIKLNDLSIIKLKRLLRKRAKKAKGWYLSSLKIMELGTMAFIWGSEVIRYVEWLSLVDHAPGVPF